MSDIKQWFMGNQTKQVLALPEPAKTIRTAFEMEKNVDGDRQAFDNYGIRLTLDDADADLYDSYVKTEQHVFGDRGRLTRAAQYFDEKMRSWYSTKQTTRTLGGYKDTCAKYYEYQNVDKEQLVRSFAVGVPDLRIYATAVACRISKPKMDAYIASKAIGDRK